MPNFPLALGGYRFRALKIADPPLQGWDVYGLQTGLAGIPGFENLDADGFFGNGTATAVRKFQHDRNLTEDGIAGMATQQKLASVLARKFREGWDLPNGIPYGHIESESGCQFGNHTPPYPNGSRDCGLVQRNTMYATFDSAFDAPDSLMRLCSTVAAKHDQYVALGQVSDGRAWQLACGAWNAPAWTDRLARGESLPPSQLEWIEGYISRVCRYASL